MSKKTNEFPIISSLADTDTFTGVQGGVLDMNVTVATLKARMNTIQDAGNYFSTNTVEAALQQIGAGQTAADSRYSRVHRYRLDYSNPVHQEAAMPWIYVVDNDTWEPVPGGTVAVAPLTAGDYDAPGFGYQDSCIQLNIPQLTTVPGLSPASPSTIQMMMGINTDALGLEIGDVVEVETFVSCRTPTRSPDVPPYDYTPYYNEKAIEQCYVVSAGAFGAFETPPISIPQFSYYSADYIWAGGGGFGYPTTLSTSTHITKAMVESDGSDFWSGFGVGVYFGPIYRNVSFIAQLYHTDFIVHRKPTFITMPGAALPPSTARRSAPTRPRREEES